MPEFGEHASFIWSALGAFIVVIGGLVIETLIGNARARRALKRLDADKAP